ncbi:superoxide dismutase family protein [Ornithinibacillus halophilus]|uniref:Superoxide dismutase [Cu-Zn] n=1 Tax=Ornithinibacillus halophilus TaxID=930117 RepID=A0A1M5IDX5_9BACI|nr:superoxide dismutase family protein [Ornithinibacillus halophilus]SHG26447.1 superoxide dismutase, Cu-Zn family [Ornithinibacillus halophilus]
MLRKLLVLPIISITLIACGNADDVEDNQGKKETHNEPSIETASMEDVNEKALIVTLEDTKGEKVGKAKFEQRKKGVEITLVAENLPPGTHGFHIHEKGLCQAPTFGSAEGHFNPTKANHGFNDPEGPHAGDLPNIEVDEDGKVSKTVLAEMVTLEEGQEHSLFQEGGTSLMIHEKADDYQSQPSGDAGERIACGVIAE